MRAERVRTLLAFLVVSVCIAAGHGTGFAADRYWNAASGDWSTGANWTPSGEPASNEYAHVSNGGTAVITQPGETCQMLILADQAAQTGSVLMTGGDLTAAWEYIGHTGTGRFVQTGGANVVTAGSGVIQVAYWPNTSSGTYDLSGTGAVSAKLVEIGANGAGAFTQNGAETSVTVSTCLYVGMTGLGGSYTLTAGRLTAREEHVGWHADGAFIQDGGVNTVTTSLRLADDAAGVTAVYTLNGGTLNVAESITGGIGNSTLTLDGGQLNVGGDITATNINVADLATGVAYTQAGARNVTARRTLRIGRRAGSGGTYNMNSTAALSVDRFLIVGSAGSGTFNQAAGTVRDVSRLILGASFSGRGAYTLDGAASRLEAVREFVGWRGVGNFTQADGTNQTPYLLIARDWRWDGAVSTYTLTGGALGAAGGDQHVGFTGRGRLNQTGGTNTTGRLYVGLGARAVGEYDLSGTGELTAETEYVGWRGTASFMHTGGTNTVNRLCVDWNWRNTSTYQLGGTGVLRVTDDEYIDCGGTFIQDGGTHTVADELHVGDAGAGTYNLSAGSLDVLWELIGTEGVFNQSGGDHHVGKLFLAVGPVSRAQFNLRGGTFRADDPACAYVGHEGAGVFEHTAGTATIDHKLYLGYAAGSNGTYKLDGPVAGLTVGQEIRVGADSGLGRLEWLDGTIDTPQVTFGAKGTWAVGFDCTVNELFNGSVFASGTTTVCGLDQATVEATDGATITHDGGSRTLRAVRAGSASGSGTFVHGAGQLTTNYLEVNANGRFEYGGGQLQQISAGGLHVAGEIDFRGNAVSIDIAGSSLVNLADGTIASATNASLTVGSGCLTILPSGFSGGIFYSYTNYGTVHTTGATLDIGPSDSFGGQGHVGDFVDCSGSLTASSGGYIHLAGGLKVRNAASVDLGAGVLTVNADTSRINNGGSLLAGEIRVGDAGAGTLEQPGGTCTVNGDVLIGCGAGDSGTYDLSNGGTLTADNLFVGYDGTGRFDHHQGDCNVKYDLHVGYGAGSRGEYVCWDVTSNLMGGFVVKCSTIGCAGTGTFTQHDGTHTVSGALTLGQEPGSAGSYVIHHGTLQADTLNVGLGGRGTLHIAGADADLCVCETHYFGEDCYLYAAAGSRIRMKGDLCIETITPTRLDPVDPGDPNRRIGLSNLTFIFCGGTGDTGDVEVAGEDRGPVAAGWDDNFAFGGLQLGEGSDAGRIRLVDEVDNAIDDDPPPDGPEESPEALYVGDLTLNARAAVDLNGLNLYYLNGGGPKEFFFGDAKLDGNVDVLDLAALANNFGKPDPAWAQGDFNGDGLVDVLDLAILANNFGKTTGGAGGNAPVPEPASAALMLLALAAAARRRRR